ncbi:hypothetical protein ACFPGO_05650 [Arcanobacterium canis]
MIGALLGAITGGIGVVTHAGTLSAPWVGLVVGFFLVAAGGWAVAERARIAGWVGYGLGVWAVTGWLLLAPPANDIYASATAGVSVAWIILSAFASIAGLSIAKLFNKKDGL